MILPDMLLELFGDEVRDDEVLQPAAWAFLKGILTMSFNRWRSTLKRSKRIIEAAIAVYQAARASTYRASPRSIHY